LLSKPERAVQVLNNLFHKFFLLNCLRLYNEESNGEEEGGGEVLDDGQQPDKDGKDQQELGVNAMALLEQHLGKSVVRPRPVSCSSNTRTSKLLYFVDQTESALRAARRSCCPGQFSPCRNPTKPATLAAELVRRSDILHNISKYSSLPANIWRPKAQAARPVIGQKDASGEEYSCRRQRLELFCEDGRRHTQFVVRWFAKEGRCLSYPWGYCPGELMEI
jgi:hypothetical protein